MSGIIGIVGLVGGPRAHAADATKGVHAFSKSCRQLADLAAYDWADIERSAHISCLDAGVIPVDRYDGMVQSFAHECTRTVEAKLGSRRDQPGLHELRIPSQELTLMFIRHYHPLFKKYCAQKNPGKGLNTRPDQLTEA